MAAVAVQRPYRGSRVSTFYPVKSVPPLSSLDSAFQLQEYISLLIRLDVHDVDTIVSLPGKTTHKDRDKDADEPGQDASESDGKKVEDGERKSEPSVDRACWIYEQLRRLAQDLSHPLITTLQQECTRSSCPQMQAGEWLYLCVAHGNDDALECCAIDYIVHTVDSATALLNSPRAFPSRLSIPQTSHRHFSSLARRLSRIFSHAYFHHREAFQQAEAESSLYARFLKLTSLFGLVPPEFLVIPESAIQADGRSREVVEPPRLLAAAIHPNQNSPSDKPAAEQIHSIPAVDSVAQVYSQTEDISSMSTASPRRVGRNRTDTMILNEPHSIAEELVKSTPESEVESRTLDTEVVESEPSLRQMWIGKQTELQEMGDPPVAEEPVPTAPGSPPVDEVPLISLVELPDSTEPPSAISLQSDPTPPMPEIKEETPSTTVPVVAMATPEETATTDAALTTEANAESLSPPEIESLQTQDTPIFLQEPPFPEIKLPEEPQSASDPAPVPTAIQAEESRPAHVEPETKEFSLDLSEPPPSEPVPPESDVTEESLAHDVDERE